jgi:replicative DNA helicase
MGREQLLQRLLTTYTGIDSQKLRTGRLSITELQTLTDALNKFATIPISIDDTAGMTISELRAKARRMQAEQGLEFLIIDYLQLINGSGRRNDNRVQEVGEISRSLKALARELNIPVLALSQLSRAVEGRSSHVPVLADLRECVVGSTRLVDATTGRWVPITDVRPGDHVLGVGTNQRIGSFIVHDVWSTGVKPVYTLTTRTGRTLTATSNHPIFTPSGWKQVGELQPGDLVATALRLPAHGHESVDDIDRCRLLGYLVGDGTYLQHRAVGFISSDTEAFADVVGIVQKHFPQVTVRMKRSGVPYQDGDFVCHYSNGYGKPGGNPLREWLRTHGMVGQRNTTKRIPAMVFEAGMAGAVAFLAGYFSADGCVKINDSKHHRPYWRIHFDTTSRGLAEDVQALLLRIGVIATISNGYQAKHGTCPIYRVVLATNASNLRCFAEQIVVPGRKGMLLQQMLQDLPERETNPGVFGLPPCISAYIAQRSLWKDQKKRMQRAHCLAWADRLNDPVLAQWATSDLLWEDIRSIEAAGEAEVFDIVVPGCGNFIANGIVAHNSGQIEADADMVIFIYREEMYDKDTDKKGIAELHIAKHRNGPLGTVDLFFDQRTTRFRNMTTYAAPEGY